nr:MAG TPA_asm: hypothetical protein [Bacteriophage sp.]
MVFSEPFYRWAYHPDRQKLHGKSAGTPGAGLGF